VDLRVEDHADPIGELGRLIALRRAYDRASKGDDLASEGDLAGALAEYEAAHRAEPENLELAFWYGLALAGNGREEEAIRIMRAPFQAHTGWVELLKRLPEAGLMPDDPEMIGRLTGTRAVWDPAAQEPPLAGPREPGTP
jgi:tetratricopeptide (TPR) repeat protein